MPDRAGHTLCPSVKKPTQNDSNQAFPSAMRTSKSPTDTRAEFGRVSSRAGPGKRLGQRFTEQIIVEIRHGRPNFRRPVGFQEYPVTHIQTTVLSKVLYRTNQIANQTFGE